MNTEISLCSFYKDYNTKIIDNNTIETKLGKCFPWILGGTKATHGIFNGKVYFEVMMTSATKDHTLAAKADPDSTPYMRVGWSTLDYQGALGEGALSFGYCSSGHKCLSNTFSDYGESFALDEAIMAYIDLDSNPPVVGFMRHGVNQGDAFVIKTTVKKAFFPHIMVRNARCHVNFGEHDPIYQAPWLNAEFISHCDPSKLHPAICPTTGVRDAIVVVGFDTVDKLNFVRDFSSKNPNKNYLLINKRGVLKTVAFEGKTRIGMPKFNPIVHQTESFFLKIAEMQNEMDRNLIFDAPFLTEGPRRRMCSLLELNGFKVTLIVAVVDNQKNNLRFKERFKESKPYPIKEEEILQQKTDFSLPSDPDRIAEFVLLDEEETKKVAIQCNKEAASMGCKSTFFKQKSSNPLVLNEYEKTVLSECNLSIADPKMRQTFASKLKYNSAVATSQPKLTTPVHKNSKELVKGNTLSRRGKHHLPQQFSRSNVGGRSKDKNLHSNKWQLQNQRSQFASPLNQGFGTNNTQNVIRTGGMFPQDNYGRSVQSTINNPSSNLASVPISTGGMLSQAGYAPHLGGMLLGMPVSNPRTSEFNNKNQLPGNFPMSGGFVMPFSEPSRLSGNRNRSNQQSAVANLKLKYTPKNKITKKAIPTSQRQFVFSNNKNRQSFQNRPQKQSKTTVANQQFGHQGNRQNFQSTASHLDQPFGNKRLNTDQFCNLASSGSNFSKTQIRSQSNVFLSNPGSDCSNFSNNAANRGMFQMQSGMNMISGNQSNNSSIPMFSTNKFSGNNTGQLDLRSSCFGVAQKVGKQSTVSNQNRRMFTISNKNKTTPGNKQLGGNTKRGTGMRDTKELGRNTSHFQTNSSRPSNATQANSRSQQYGFIPARSNFGNANQLNFPMNNRYSDQSTSFSSDFSGGNNRAVFGSTVTIAGSSQQSIPAYFNQQSLLSNEGLDRQTRMLPDPIQHQNFNLRF